MGNEESSESEESHQRISTKPKVFGLHGWRTNAKILKMQTAALVHHTDLDMITLDAPHEADGQPDELISQYYPNHQYYQWYYRSPLGNRGLEETLQFLSNIFHHTSGYDGGLGFSQGAGILTLFLLDKIIKSEHIPLKFVILIGGVEPPPFPQPSSSAETSNVVNIPSLHIIGRKDPLSVRSEKLVTYFHESLTTVIYHDEGHNIPSVRTGLYSTIYSWLQSI